MNSRKLAHSDTRALRGAVAVVALLSTWLLTAIGGCGSVEVVAPDGTGLVPALDGRVNGAWRLEVDASGGAWPLEALACVGIEARSVSSWRMGCEVESLLGSFSAVREADGAIRLDAVVAASGSARQVRLVIRPVSETLLDGTIALVGFDGTLQNSLPVVLTRE